MNGPYTFESPKIQLERFVLDFIKADEIRNLLHDYGIVQDNPDDDHVYLRMQGGETVQHLSVSVDGVDEGAPQGAESVSTTEADLPSIVEHLLNKLHHNQMVLVPVGKWRSVFDIVAFSLAENEEWQRIDAAASVELNSRDPLLADAGDLHVLEELFKALLRDSDTPDQGLILITVGVPVLMEVVPGKGLRMSFGNEAIAAEVREICAA
ncbi:MAG: hypothetical protein MK101_02120 [Phycisphaerales bacterium]|nr:hypothetical protein [Phycisphaerales bacterium]